MSLGALLVATLLLQGEGTAPLRKSDLVRLLSGAEIAAGELALLVRRNCLTFEPSARDRNDLRLMGADAALFAAIEDCVRRTARRRSAARPAPPAPPASRRPAPGPTPAAPPPALPPPPPPPPPPGASAQRSGFVAGGGQRGPAGALLPRALVFEVRDSAGQPLAGQVVTFTAINSRVEPANATTDASGQVRAGVTLGQRVGSATVIGSIGVVEKQVAFNVAAGAAQQLVVFCEASSVAERFAIRPDSVVMLRVVAQDAFSNPTPLLGLRAAVADARIVRVINVSQDSVAGKVTVKPDQPGTTSLAVIANGMRQYLTVTVPPKAAPGKVDCP